MSGDRSYLSVVETAKLLRKQFAVKFPGVKFRVRSSSYSGGASIYVQWTDGPTSAQVRDVTDQYHGAGFDGMIDMKYGYDHWLLPDGSTMVAHCSGTVGSMGIVDSVTNEKPHPEARRVHFGADYIGAQREFSDAFIAKCKAKWESLSGQQQCDLLNGPLLLKRSYREDYAAVLAECTAEMSGATYWPRVQS